MRTISKLSVSGEWVGHKGPLGKNWMWTHPSYPDVQVRHCGHPTALRPYFIADADGKRSEDILFRNLRQAQWWVEHGGHLLDDEAADELYGEMIHSE